MRELKFRCWHKEEELMSLPIKMIPSFPFEIRVEFLTKDKRRTKNNLVILDGKIIWMQYTGIKDMNGVDIYEGDIVRCQLTTGRVVRGAIEWQATMFVITDIGHLYKYKDSFIEVLGNIYENKELLNEQEETDNV